MTEGTGPALTFDKEFDLKFAARVSEGLQFELSVDLTTATEPGVQK